MNYNKSILFVAFALMMALCGCNSRKKVVYMQDVPAGQGTYNVKEMQNIVIRPGDKLSIVVKSDIPEMANAFNLAVPYNYVGTEGLNHYGNTQTAYYTVNPDGTIDFPVLGEIAVAGMTREAIGDTIKARLLREDLLKDAVVVVDYGNLTFSVLGDVKTPGRFNFNKDCITLMEAISMAGDLAITGVRSNVLVMRQDANGNLSTYRVDLRNLNELVQSPVYFVQQNDVIYVAPNQKQARNSESGANSALEPSFWISLVSLFSSLTTTIVAILSTTAKP